MMIAITTTAATASHHHFAFDAPSSPSSPP